MKTFATSWEESVEWTRIVAGCIVHQDGKYLLVQEKQSHAYGLWNLPAGHVDRGESIEAAAIREMKEETGYDVELEKRIGIYHEYATKPIKHAFTARITGGELAPDPEEILQARWLTYREVSVLNSEGKIRSEWIWEAVRSVEDSSR